MKKILIFLSFVFAVALYASPPPVPVPQFQTDQLQCFMQDNVQPVQVYSIENVQTAEYAAVVNAGSFELSVFVDGVGEEVSPVKLPAVVSIDKSYLGMISLNKPPSDSMYEVVYNCTAAFKMNKQHTNFGYPLTADNC